MEGNNFQDDSLTFKELIERLISWVLILWRRRIRIIALTFLFASLYILYEKVTRPVYTAETTFMIEDISSNVGQASSLVNMMGFNLDGISGDANLFDTDHIIELYTSNRMLKATFLTEVELDGIRERLITRWGRETKQDKKWRAEDGMEEFSFQIPESEMTVKHDSILFEVFEDFLEKNLVVDKPDRKLSILSVKVNAKDALFAQYFNKNIVRLVNQFYLETKSRKSRENLDILQMQADSVRGVINESLGLLASNTQNQPNLNPIYYSKLVPSQQLQIDLEASAAVYEELVKNLEIAKITHRKSLPLIQVIDEPVLPLMDDKDSWLKLIVISFFFSGLLSVFIISIQETIKNLNLNLN